MSARALSRSLTHAVGQANDTANHCALTIAARLPVLARCLVAPTAEGLAEWNEAYSEKVAAVFEGAVAASTAWQIAMMRSALRMPTPTAFANDIMRVMNKAAHPARRRVKANSRRLSAPKEA